MQLAGNLLAVLSQALCPRVDTEGMVAAYEFMYVTPGIQNLIRENKAFRIDSEIQTGKRYGMQLLDDNLFAHFSAGRISAEEAIDKSRNPGNMVDKMQRAGFEVEKPDDTLPDPSDGAGGAPPGAKPPGDGPPGGPPKPPPGAPPAATPGAAQSEAERQAQIAANRARMMGQKKA